MDPWGEVIATTSHEPAVIVADIDFSKVDEVRSGQIAAQIVFLHLQNEADLRSQLGYKLVKMCTQFDEQLLQTAKMKLR